MLGEGYVHKSHFLQKTTNYCVPLEFISIKAMVKALELVEAILPDAEDWLRVTNCVNKHTHHYIMC